MGKQVASKEYYTSSKYGSLGRFISYYYQIKVIKESEAKKVLFIGVGDGLVPQYLRNIGIEVITCDFDSELKPDVVSDVRKLPFGENEFDAVAIFEVLEHIPFEDFEATLEKIKLISKSKVLISVPKRHTVFELIFKFPGIRTIVKRDFIRFALSIPLRFPGFKESGQHYWEIDSGDYTIRRVRSAFEKHFRIDSEVRPPLHDYQIFFILSKKNI